MATIHNTTMNPTKLDLLAAWLPAQPWYRPTGQEPQLARVGGFRLDDPAGEVGIEFMVVTDGSGDRTVTYQVPMTYRASALDGADEALIGTSEHGVLGRRWLYDGVHDPVLRAQLIALIQGEAEPQAQTVSDTPDLTVTSQPPVEGSLTFTSTEVVANGQAGTDLRAGELSVRICRVLQPGDGVSSSAGSPCPSATWRLPDGTQARGVFATARYVQA
jgi:Maltokinase N-terminal cap domain